jgi:phosphogluconate dehydratase
MPELHKLTPPLGLLQERGFKVALITDGRMSGASGKIPAAIHLTPECSAGGTISRIRDGDEILLDAPRGILEVGVGQAELESRQPVGGAKAESQSGLGRELFDGFRQLVSGAEQGAMSILVEQPVSSEATEMAAADEY